MTSTEPAAIPVAPLDYAPTGKTPWHAVIRAVLLTMIAVSITTLISSMGFVAFGYWRSGRFSTAIEMDPAISITLITCEWCSVAAVLVCACACLRFSGEARRLLVIALVVAGVIAIVGRGCAAYYFAADVRYGLADIVYYMAYTFLDGLEFLIPSIAVIWIFTRAAVRELFH